MDIKRFSRSGANRARAVAHGDVIYTVATAFEPRPSVYDQAWSAFAQLEVQLHEAGSDKRHLLRVQVYLSDISTKPEFDRAWTEWIDLDHVPQRAVVGAALAGSDLVELVVTAAMVR